MWKFCLVLFLVCCKEAELLEYFEKKFAVDGLTSRINEKVKGVKAEQKEYFKSGKICPSCDSDHVTKKGQRVLKKARYKGISAKGVVRFFQKIYYSQLFKSC